MQKFTTLTGIAAYLPIANIDTDMIIAKQYLKTIKRSGLGRWLFAAMRYDDAGNPVPDFVLNKKPQAQILLAGENFGCGSSREHAPWSLADFGVRILIAPSFADIFYNNCFKNGLLPVRLGKEAIAELAQSPLPVTVDLQEQSVSCGNRYFSFEIEPEHKNTLIDGLDAIAPVMEMRAAIEEYEAGHFTQQPWLKTKKKNMANILLVAGDGIGPEIMEQAKRILACFKREMPMTLVEKLIGGAAIDACGSPFPNETAQAAQTADAVLLGAVGGPAWDALPLAQRPEKGLLGIRKTLGLYANLRPLTIWPQLVGFSPLRPEILQNVSFIIVRELTGDLYFGEPRGIQDQDGVRSAFNTMTYTETEIRRVAVTAFDFARQRNKKVCSIDKANVLETMRLWREVVEDVGRGYPDIALEHLYVDNAAMQIIRKPASFDVMLTPNMFGDILSDEAAVLSGSLGLLPSASIGGKSSLYEPIHGSAPDIAGQGIANPIGMILSVGMMLEIAFGKPEWESCIRRAVSAVLDAGLRTQDIWEPGMEKVSTEQMGAAIERQIMIAGL